MFPAVVVDLGSQLTPDETAWMLDACNAAVVRGTCELDTTATEAPRAVAIVRWLGSERRSVRIEVGLREADRASWSVREIEFSSRDPARERWRSVGLVLATLVGEVDAAAADRQTLAHPATPVGEATRQAGEAARVAAQAAAAQAETPRAPAPALAAARSAPAPSPVPAELPAPVDAAPVVRATPPEDAGERTTPRATPRAAPPPPPGVFIGLGVLAGAGATLDPLRWGGSARGGWISPRGWALSASADYSQLSFDGGEVDVAWWRASLGPGYRAWLSERWSVELGLELGVRNLRVSPDEAGSIRSSSWNPMGAAHLEAWWQALASGGAWAGLTMSSIGRETRLLDRGGEADAVVPAVEFHASMGLWWAP